MYSIRDSVTYYENHHIIDRACHRAFDGMKLSLNKVDAINSNILDKDARLPFLLPIVDYHAKWKNDNVDTLFREEINDNRNAGYYGYSYHALDPIKTDELFCYDTGYYSDVRTTPVTEAIAVSDERMTYIEDITTLCNENDIKLMYYISPFIFQEDIDYPSVRKWVNSLDTHIAETILI